MPARTLGPEGGVDYEIPNWLGRGTKHSFIRVWKPFPSQRVLKNLR